MAQEQKDKRLFVSTLVLVILHVAGFIGIRSSYRDIFLQLSPINLLLSTVLLLLNHKEFNKPFYLFCGITFLSGFFIELLGIKTGLIFGSYSYGNTLGFKIAGVPFIIGINWLILVYSVGVICNKLNISLFFKSLLGAAMLVILDFFMEPVAIRHDFWHWNALTIPTQNYIAWFITGFLLLLIFYRSSFEKDNKLAQALYLVQLVFFILLGIF